MPSWFLPSNATEGVLLLHIQPNAKQTQWAGIHGQALKIRLNAAPVDGKANCALIHFLSEQCALPRTAFHLASGATSRQKRIKIKTPNAETLEVLVKKLEHFAKGK